MDVLTLSGLTYHANHGYYEKERAEGNDFEVDLVFYADLTAAGETDDLEMTLDYQRAEAIVRDVMEGPSVKLIETLAASIGRQLFAEFPRAQKIEVRVRKLNPPLQTPTDHAQIVKTWNRS